VCSSRSCRKESNLAKNRNKEKKRGKILHERISVEEKDVDADSNLENTQLSQVYLFPS
jgi:hypothetical protein